MRSVRREGNRLTDHFLALRRVPSSANLDHLSELRELPQGFARSQPHLPRSAAAPLLCIACHVRERPFSPPNADTFVRWPPPHYDTFGFIFACWWPGGPWIWSGVVEVFQKKVPVANTSLCTGRPQYEGANRPSSDGKQDDGKSAPFIQFTWRAVVWAATRKQMPCSAVSQDLCVEKQ